MTCLTERTHAKKANQKQYLDYEGGRTPEVESKGVGLREDPTHV